MPKKQKEATIPNWSVFGTHGVSIEFHLNEEKKYQTALTIFLDNGEEPKSDDDRQVVTVLLDIIVSKPKEEAVSVAGVISAMFEHIHNKVFVFDDEGSIQHEYELDMLVNTKAKKQLNNAKFH